MTEARDAEEKIPRFKVVQYGEEISFEADANGSWVLWDGGPSENYGAKQLAADFDRVVQERDTLARRVTWQPIETAPKDAMALLVFVPGHGVQMGTWLPISMEWCWSDSDDTQPTHWMPLPAPPVRD